MADKAGLTPRDLDIARLAAAGHTDREIAGRLFITMNTVKYQLKRAYEALGPYRMCNFPRVEASEELVRETVIKPFLGTGLLVPKVAPSLDAVAEIIEVNICAA